MYYVNIVTFDVESNKIIFLEVASDQDREKCKRNAESIFIETMEDVLSFTFDCIDTEDVLECVRNRVVAYGNKCVMMSEPYHNDSEKTGEMLIEIGRKHLKEEQRDLLLAHGMELHTDLSDENCLIVGRQIEAAEK